MIRTIREKGITLETLLRQQLNMIVYMYYVYFTSQTHAKRVPGWSLLFFRIGLFVGSSVCLLVCASALVLAQRSRRKGNR